MYNYLRLVIVASIILISDVSFAMQPNRKKVSATDIDGITSLEPRYKNEHSEWFNKWLKEKDKTIQQDHRYIQYCRINSSKEHTDRLMIAFYEYSKRSGIDNIDVTSE